MALPEEFFHEPSESVRFWVQVDDVVVGASVSRNTLHYVFNPGSTTDEAMTTFRSRRAELDNAVRRRVARGAREPVMLRESDLRADAEGAR